MLATGKARKLHSGGVLGGVQNCVVKDGCFTSDSLEKALQFWLQNRRVAPFSVLVASPNEAWRMQPSQRNLQYQHR